jgi:hypothetical protein
MPREGKEAEAQSKVLRAPARLSYAYTKFSEAVSELTVGEGDVRSRLYDAYFFLCRVTLSDLPEELRNDFKWIRDQLTKHGPLYDGQGRLQATLSRIKNRTGAKIAKRIVELKYRIEVWLGEK